MLLSPLKYQPLRYSNTADNGMRFTCTNNRILYDKPAIIKPKLSVPVSVTSIQVDLFHPEGSVLFGKKFVLCPSISNHHTQIVAH